MPGLCVSYKRKQFVHVLCEAEKGGLFISQMCKGTEYNSVEIQTSIRCCTIKSQFIVCYPKWCSHHFR